MNKGYCVALVCAGLLSFSLTSMAGNSQGDATFTLGDGYYRFASKRHDDNTGVPFGSIGYNLTDRWGIEALLGFFTTNSRMAIDNGREVTGTLFALDAIYRFKPYCFLEPYIIAGPGALSMSPNGNDANTQGNINGGVGAQFFFSQSIALRLEIRDIYTMVGGKNDFYANGGVSFLF